MKVLLVNGSPNRDGCTNRALEEVKKSLVKEGIEAEIFWIGNQNQGCIACGKCFTLGKCVFDDTVNEFAAKAKEADGFVFGSPVYYASMAGGIKSFMDRLFYSSSKYLKNKPGAAVVSCRRAGSTLTFSEMNMYFTINNMPVVSSQYWNGVHGNTKEEVEQDLEGLQTMRTLGTNIAWLLKSLKSSEKPSYEKRIGTNFIR